MKPDIARFFTLQRRIFGICPKCGNFFRLSDCRIFLKRKPALDWMDQIDLENGKLADIEQRLEDEEEQLREKEREKGRRRAQQAIKKIDPIFAPRKLEPDDAKVIFHPIDFVVFNGMNTAKSIKNIVMLDRYATQLSHRKIQKSVEKAIDRERYEWQTLRVDKEGNIEIE